MRVVPAGFNTSTRVVTSKLRQSELGAAVLRANGRHFLFPRGNARAAETAAVEERKSRRFMVPRSCPSWDRTRTLLIQSQACCQLHQGAVFYMELRGLEPLTSWVRSRRSPS